MRHPTRARIVAVFAAAIVAGLTGCTAGQPTDGPGTSMVTSPSPSASPTPAIVWPDGADSSTPPCQDASAAAVDVVNQSLGAVSAEEGIPENPVPWLSARPDVDLGAWTLTGIVANGQTGLDTEGGAVVVWATRSDPTSAGFAGQVYWVSGSASNLTRFDPLLAAYVGPSPSEDAPAAALRCGRERARTP